MGKGWVGCGVEILDKSNEMKRKGPCQMVHVSTLSRAQQASRERVVEDDDDPNLGSRQPRIRKLQSVEEGGGGWPWPMALSLSSSGFSLALKPME